MTTFLLVHGGWHGSWCWKRVRGLLREQGHEVFTPTLTGVGERSHLASPAVDLETHILDVVNLIRWEELSDLVLCGHSYAGAVVTGVADRLPERIRALVYLDAFVPADGEHLFSFPPARLVDGWQVPPMTAAQLNVNAADRDWVDSQCTMQPEACWSQPISLTGGISAVRDITYVWSAGWPGGRSPFTRCHEQARERGWRTVTVSCGHDVMLDDPEGLTRILLDAGRTGGLGPPPPGRASA